METEEFIGSLLYFLEGRIELSYLEHLRTQLELTQTELLDLSESDIRLTINCWDEYFVMKRETIELTDYYQKYREIVKKKFFDQMSQNKKEIFIETFLDIHQRDV